MQRHKYPASEIDRMAKAAAGPQMVIVPLIIAFGGSMAKTMFETVDDHPDGVLNRIAEAKHPTYLV